MNTGSDVTLPLASKGTSFGSIHALPNGELDTAMVEGIDPDLRVRPFFHQGGEFAFAVGAFKDEMGLEVPDPDLCQSTDPASPVKTTSPAGMVLDPTLDTIKRTALAQR